MTPEIPVFDLQNPWVGLIQLALFYILPRLTGLVTDRLSKPAWKIATLGVLSVLGTVLTRLLDVAVANGWSTLDWMSLFNLVINAGVVFIFSNVIYKTVIVPTGQNEKDARNETFKIIGPDPKRVFEEAVLKSAAAADTIANRAASAEVVARQVATAVVEEKLAAIPKAKVTRATAAKPSPATGTSKSTAAKSTARAASKPAAKGTAATK